MTSATLAQVKALFLLFLNMSSLSSPLITATKVPEAERMITVSVKTGETLTAPTTIPTVSGYEFKGWRTKDGKPYDFTVAPTGKFTLYANWEKIPDPKPEPEPEPEAPTYTLTVKGGTFTYNGGEAMTSASVPVDAEVKVTLNQSAVPEGMVFDLWAMDEASLLGNPAVAYNEESFTIRRAAWPRAASSPWKPSTGMPPSRASPAFWALPPSSAWPVQARRSSCGRATASAWSCTRSISSPRRKRMRWSNHA